jgi:hypothetical protein
VRIEPPCGAGHAWGRARTLDSGCNPPIVCMRGRHRAGQQGTERGGDLHFIRKPVSSGGGPPRLPRSLRDERARPGWLGQPDFDRMDRIDRALQKTR